jgi:hypothetical protein
LRFQTAVIHGMKDKKLNNLLLLPQFLRARVGVVAYRCSDFGREFACQKTLPLSFTALACFKFLPVPTFVEVNRL